MIRKYYIDRSICDLPRGFYLERREGYSRIVVYDDVDGKSILYEEEIKTPKQKSFQATYDDDRAPVHIDDGELIGELIGFICEVCGQQMEVVELDRAEDIAWVCCPHYLQGDDEHDSCSVELNEEIEEMFLNQKGEDED